MFVEGRLPCDCHLQFCAGRCQAALLAIISSARVFPPFGPVYLGPGFRVRRAGAYDEPIAALYEIVIWDSLKFYAVIVPPEATRG